MRYGPMFGPDVTFLGVPPCTLEEPVTVLGRIKSLVMV